MSVSPVSDDIDKDVFFELLAIRYCHFDHLVHQLRLIGVDMDDRRLDGLSHVCAVKTSPCFCWGCRKTDLVVSYDMDDTINVVMVQVGHLEAFINDSLAGNCSITVNQHGQALFLILQCIFNSLNVTHDDWINSLQMRRIRQDSQTNVLPLNIALSCHTEMILDIPRVSP